MLDQMLVAVRQEKIEAVRGIGGVCVVRSCGVQRAAAYQRRRPEWTAGL